MKRTISNGFAARCENRVRFRPRGSGKTRLCRLLGLAAVAGAAFAGCAKPRVAEYPVPGMPLLSEYSVGKDNVTNMADALLSERVGAHMRHDVPLVLTDRSGGVVQTVRFRADGYDPELRIAYEWTGASNAVYELEQDKLEVGEVSLITNYRFGGDYIIVFDFDYRYTSSRGRSLWDDVKEEIDRFSGYYTNRDAQ